MERDWHWNELFLVAIGLFLLWAAWLAISKTSGLMCDEKIRQALDDSTQIVAAGLARPASPLEQERSFRKWLVPGICSEEQFRESFHGEK